MTQMALIQIARPPRRFAPRAWRYAVRSWDAASIYLPLLLMGALALGTYWLARNTPSPSAPPAEKKVTHAVDYFMHNFRVKNFDDVGQLKSEIAGTAARHYMDTDTLEIDQGRIRSVSREGQLTTSTAHRVLSNGDGSELQLIGDARVVREEVKTVRGPSLPRMALNGEFLHVFVADERVKSHQPVRLTRAQDYFTADAMSYNNLTGVVELTGRVKGVLTPTPSSAAR